MHVLKKWGSRSSDQKQLKNQAKAWFAAQTVLSLARHSMGGGILLGGQELLEELLEEVEEEDELTRWVVSEDWGLKIIGTLEVVPLTGELPEVKPSSAELEWQRPSTGGKSGLWIRVHLKL